MCCYCSVVTQIQAAVVYATRYTLYHAAQRKGLDRDKGHGGRGVRGQQGCMRKEDKGEMDRNRKFRIHLKASDVTDKILERECKKQKGHFFINRPKLNGEEIQALTILKDLFSPKSRHL